MPMVLAGRLSADERAARSRELLETVGLGKRLDHFPAQLSGGEQQRVTIARAIANRPELLLLDEPTGDLDSVNSAIVMDLLTKLHERGLTLVMVTHDVYLKSFADRVVWMRDGKIQRVERNSDEAKRTAREQLADDLAAARARRETPVDEQVEVRRPANYDTHQSYDSSRPQQATLGELANAPVVAPQKTTTKTKKKKKKKGDKAPQSNGKSAAAPAVSLVDVESASGDSDDDDDDDHDDDSSSE
eukprot:TRINITY_DN1009_c1_g1_i4.p1 TRINITY_DN1009_c1_g1~~TRINITY_DN1009_c1_g1_i4.p1  ORF type:complete len:245 (-),score=175.79 TRINITY_DN1009_c1_g1_i4:65-799(-)